MLEKDVLVPPEIHNIVIATVNLNLISAPKLYTNLQFYCILKLSTELVIIIISYVS